MADMPARINVGLHSGWSADDTARMKGDTCYVRADLVEQMAAALRATLCELSACSRQLTNLRCNVAEGGSVDRALVGARAALQAYEAAQPANQAGRGK